MNHKSIIFLMMVSVSLIGFLYQTSEIGNNHKNLQIDLQEKFTQWKKDFSMIISQKQEFYRREIFVKNLKQIFEHNSKPGKNYELGLNQFSHLSSEQFSGLFLGISERINQQIKDQQFSNSMLEIVQNVDWQALGKVSVVKNQGSCDAGYAFCTASLVQSFYMFQNKNILLSEQQIVDCSANYTTFGCSSGSRIGTINFAKQKGLTLQSGYPYKGVKGNCTKPTGQYLANFTLIQSNGCQQISKNLYTSPMTVAVNAQTWQSYKSGIYDGCTSTQVNHDTYLVGVTTDYWRVKNSWGNKWGQYGYIRLKIGNTCGICQKTGFGFK